MASSPEPKANKVVSQASKVNAAKARVVSKVINKPRRMDNSPAKVRAANAGKVNVVKDKAVNLATSRQHKTVKVRARVNNPDKVVVGNVVKAKAANKVINKLPRMAKGRVKADNVVKANADKGRVNADKGRVKVVKRAINK